MKFLVWILLLGMVPAAADADEPAAHGGVPLESLTPPGMQRLSIEAPSAPDRPVRLTYGAEASVEVRVEVLDDTNSSALAHLAWHSLVEVARKNLPVLVLDDSSTEADFGRIEHLLTRRAIQYGVVFRPPSPRPGCESGQCRMN